MDSTPINWSSLITPFLDEASEIPSDVTFQIMEGEQIQDVKAHKMILGIVSPVFRTMFFTTQLGDKTAQEVKIKETTKEAFQIMIDGIYNKSSIENSLRRKSIEEVITVVDLLERYQIPHFMETIQKNLSSNIKNMSLKEIFDLLNLVEKYQIPEIRQTAKNRFSNYPVTDDTVLEVAAEAMQYTDQMQDEAHHLLINCAKFLQSKLKDDAKSILKFVSENNNQKEAVVALLDKIHTLPPIPCSNCNYERENCQDGKPVKDEDFRVGMVVTNNTNASNSYWSGYGRVGTGRVTEIIGAKVKVATITPGVTQNANAIQFGGTYSKIEEYSEVPIFLFYCN